MPELHYTALNAEGLMVRGILSATDKHDLITQLEGLQLFLVSYSEDQKEISSPAPALESSSISGMSALNLPSGTIEITQKKRIVLTAVVCISFVIGLLNWHLKARARIDVSTLNQKLGLIRGDSTRADIEKILGPSIPAPKGVRRYLIAPYWAIDMTFETHDNHERPSDIPVKNSAQILRISQPISH